MLIAPIFHNNYLTTQQPELQDNVSSTSNSQNKTDNDSIASAAAASTTAVSRYSIFKTALNRGTELIRSTFMSKSTNYSDYSLDSNSSPSSSSSSSSVCTITTTTTTMTASTAAAARFTNRAAAVVEASQSRIQPESEPKSESCSPSDSDNCSSPDSIRTELMYFKPINREVQTSSSSAMKIMRIPSIRSASSTSTTIQSPCPSPFFIPITPQRQSAFTFVFQATPAKCFHDNLLKPKKSSKRRNVNPQTEQLTPCISKRQKTSATETRLKQKSTSSKTAASARQTRSMKKPKSHEAIVVVGKQQKEFKSPLIKIDTRTRTKKATAAVPMTADETEFRRVTRSMKN